ncbi:hypothetical protein F2Q70_00030319 [Brassica cretica]|uniref:Uncharacterized protein n=1 Tax=Brassica cretica TaxID=69181 RepID=A0A8S9FDF7_BRACR|nr:hypothetical protein F2Q70_00030319 [Brassica cretica]
MEGNDKLNEYIVPSRRSRGVDPIFTDKSGASRVGEAEKLDGGWSRDEVWTVELGGESAFWVSLRSGAVFQFLDLLLLCGVSAWLSVDVSSLQIRWLGIRFLVYGGANRWYGGVTCSVSSFVRPLFSLRSSWVRNVSPEHVRGGSHCCVVPVVAVMVRVLLLVSVLRRGRL